VQGGRYISIFKGKGEKKREKHTCRSNPCRNYTKVDIIVEREKGKKGGEGHMYTRDTFHLTSQNLCLWGRGKRKKGEDGRLAYITVLTCFGRRKGGKG